MKTIVAAAVLALATAAVAADQPAPDWAFYGRDGKPAGEVQPAGPQSVPGSRQRFTRARIDDFRNSPDWFPDRHPPMPKVVAHGGAGTSLACASCHLVSGMGHPESASLAGLSSAYIQEQIADYRSGARRNPVTVAGKPQINSVASMAQQAADLTPAEIKAASDYFGALKPIPWVKVVEARRVPKTWTDGKLMRLTLPGGGTEPLGSRIIELAQDQTLQLRRDPYSGTVAYVPPGSVARGKRIAARMKCASCHADDMRGVGPAPRLAGRSPLYLFRQLVVFKLGGRTGQDAQPMLPVVAKLSQGDMIALAAYAASLPP